MSFLMSANIKIGGFAPFKPSSFRWKRSMDDICDSATIVVPAMCRLIDKERNYSIVQTGMAIKEGMEVTIVCGYDGVNTTRFRGFVSRLNFKVPVEIECEGFSYAMRRKMINKTFGTTTLRAVLEYITQGTGIKLNSKMSGSMVFEKVTFQNYTAYQVLEWIKDNYHLTVCFFFDELYVGWIATFTGSTVRHRLNWNVANADALVFKTYEGSEVHIEGISTNQDGTRIKRKANNVLKPGDVKRVKTVIKSDADMQAMANDLQVKQNQSGYSGSIVGFLVPACEPGMTTEIIDKQYDERNGKYFISSVSGSFGPNGGRQSIGIEFGLSK